MRIFNTIKTFAKNAFNSYPAISILTGFSAVYIPIKVFIIRPQEIQLELQKQQLKLERDKLDNEKELLEEILANIKNPNLSQLGIETFGEDVSLSGEAPQHDTSTDTPE